MYGCVYVCTSIYLHNHPFLQVLLYRNQSIYISIYPSVEGNISIYLYIHPSILPFFHLSNYPSIYLPTYLSTYLPTYLSIYLFIYLSVCLSIYLSNIILSSQILLYRKHVISELPYITELVRHMEGRGLTPLPLFITGVDGHIAVCVC
jgi:hypothetical protein